MYCKQKYCNIALYRFFFVLALIIRCLEVNRKKRCLSTLVMQNLKMQTPQMCLLFWSLSRGASVGSRAALIFSTMSAPSLPAPHVVTLCL